MFRFQLKFQQRTPSFARNIKFFFVPYPMSIVPYPMSIVKSINTDVVFAVNLSDLVINGWCFGQTFEGKVTFYLWLVIHTATIKRPPTTYWLPTNGFQRTSLMFWLVDLKIVLVWVIKYSNTKTHCCGNDHDAIVNAAPNKENMNELFMNSKAFRRRVDVLFIH